MIDIKLIRENKDLVKENIRKKFQEQKLPLVDKAYDIDVEYREVKTKGDNLRNKKNELSDTIGLLMREGNTEEANRVKEEISTISNEIEYLTSTEEELRKELIQTMMYIPNIIDKSVPIGKDDSENVQVDTFGEAKVPSYEIPYHADIMESLNGLDLDSARRVAGNGFYYLTGNVARLHSAMLSYARDFMIDKGFTYVV
ncbi:MAG TPA: serine--tRNA ligase, partial [Bacilli bacterium]|nr:serine--tRNA ligase [Bacilli bacterium]